jgi:hypothetical protein
LIHNFGGVWFKVNDTGERNRHAIWIGSWGIKGENATCATEPSFGDMGAPCIQNGIRFPIILWTFPIKIDCGNDKMNVASHGTIRTIALPNCDTIPIATKPGSNGTTVTLDGIHPLFLRL